jgi:hypothetical protein
MATINSSMDFPEVIYAPAYPDPRPGNGGVRFETRTSAGGEIVGFAFRDRERLVRALGPAQPWMAMRLDRLAEILGAAGIERILIDPPAAESTWSPERVEQLAEVMEDNRG